MIRPRPSSATAALLSLALIRGGRSLSIPAAAAGVRRAVSATPPSGDHAGHVAKFSPSGSLLPVPDHYVPEVLLEWGQAPYHLEVLTSDTVREGVLERKEIRVLPAVGCGVDNLDVERRGRDVDLSDVTCGESWAAADSLLPGGRKHLSTTFVGGAGTRTRVDFPLRVDLSGGVPPSPGDVEVALERSVGESTAGSRADGGGLDGRTVYQLCGKPNGWWNGSNDDGTETKWEIPADAEEMESGGTTVNFPVGVSISYGSLSDGSYAVDVRCVEGEERSVIRRSYGPGLEKCTKVHQWMERS
mmetsp:Transcript_13457/g.26855  ORF Transcript_13457/g.26855 Transcript_13457/m.26855 type:complete len:301 (-) Transcript_13457:52-954(-)